MARGNRSVQSAPAISLLALAWRGGVRRPRHRRAGDRPPDDQEGGIGALEVDELTVRRLRIVEQEGPARLAAPPGPTRSRR